MCKYGQPKNCECINKYIHYYYNNQEEMKKQTNKIIIKTNLTIHIKVIRFHSSERTNKKF